MKEEEHLNQTAKLGNTSQMVIFILNFEGQIKGNEMNKEDQPIKKYMHNLRSIIKHGSNK